ncbi:MAG: S-layer homology domain-containing protein, partial [Monoglobaceae bacterium]
MKKITALFISAMMIMGTAVFAEPNVLTSEDGMFEYTEDGTVSAYYGGEVLFLPSEINGTPIREVGEKLCFDMGISTVYTEDGIEKIGESAFEGCNAVYADIAATVKNVGDRAFANCENLEYVVLYSTDVSFGYDAFMGTGYIYFTVPCTADAEELDVLAEKISDAKGDPYFGFTRMHTAITQSMEEKDIFGESMIYCEACGFKGSRYLEDIELPFSDVSADAWYYAYVQTAYSLGIVNGKSETEFDPNAGMTCAEAVKIAACIHAYQTGDVIDSTAENWETWYDPYFTYCYDTGIIEE